MAALPFLVIEPGSLLKECFDAAWEKAGFEHGHGGYSGSLVEKTEVVLRRTEPMTKAEAEQFVWTDEEIWSNDKWGPAFAVPIRDEAGQHYGYALYGLSPS
jgi:hypothetical protein